MKLLQSLLGKAKVCGAALGVMGGLLLGLQTCRLSGSAQASDRGARERTSAAPVAPVEPDPARDDDLPSSPEPEGKTVLDNAVLSYSLDRPDRRLSLPTVLNEVSDIAVLSASEVACVQDERGSVYVYDIELRRITREVRFANKGDYEGLAATDAGLFVLRSDGTLYHLSTLSHHPEVKTYQLHLPTHDNEGLCYDAGRDRLLIAPKSHEPTVEAKDETLVFAFDLKSMQLQADPALILNVKAIRQFAKRHELPVPRRRKKNGERMHTALKLVPSAIAVHPVTGDIFVLSSIGHVLVSSDITGNITGYAMLDADLFRQPEGIAFLPNGDMLIANEAAGKVPTLLLFHWNHPSN
jgi:hypothetical protein